MVHNPATVNLTMILSKECRLCERRMTVEVWLMNSHFWLDFPYVCIWPAAKWRKSSFSKKKRKEFIICVCACLKPWGLDPRPNHENYCSTTSSAANLSVSIQLTCRLQSAQELLALACPLLLLDHWSNHFIQAWDFCSNRNIDMMCDKNTDDFDDFDDLLDFMSKPELASRLSDENNLIVLHTT